MQKNTIDLNSVRTYTDGRFHLFVGLYEKIGLPQIFNPEQRRKKVSAIEESAFRQFTLS